ncbi:nucleolin [Fasciola hepatica]|uniref:Nucleolin n=1 Tax=Fasciola hepatica TaxID=6192 RepID=A0A4E0QYT5_FASHE|nr:nucleolin [Fasciola hepatica]
MPQLKTLCPTSVSARIQSGRHGSRRKHAFVEFKSEEAARLALASIDGKLVADRPVKAELCSERSAYPMESDSVEPGKRLSHWISPGRRMLPEFCLTTLYVTCIPRVTKQDDLRQLFEKASSFDFNINAKNNVIRLDGFVFSVIPIGLQKFMLKTSF